MQQVEVAEGVHLLFPYDPVMVCYRGSHSHGTYIPPDDPNGVDDIDLFAVCIATKSHYFGLQHWEGTDFWKNDYDVVTYDIKKFFRLLLKGNPNCIGMLWLRPCDYVWATVARDMMVWQKRIFLGKKPIYEAFGGYARSQLKRMTAFQTSSTRYMGAKRKKLVEQYGYDVKNASHLVRLLNMCRDFLTTGEIKVYRDTDADMLIDIKQGKWKLEDVQEYAENAFQELERLYPFCDVPIYPDKSAADKLLIDIMELHFYGGDHALPT